MKWQGNTSEIFVIIIIIIIIIITYIIIIINTNIIDIVCTLT